MEMVAEGVLEISSHLGHLNANSTFTVVVEGKETKEVRSTNALIVACHIIDEF